MYYVYLLQSLSHPDQRYTGYTTNLRERLETHNAGGSAHTSKFRPWKMVAFMGFEEQTTALAFEKYLKSGSGRAFAAKRLWPQGNVDKVEGV